jgi:plastocyanin
LLRLLGCWAPEARRRHDTLLRRYLRARGWPDRLDAATREAYQLASASNALSGALRYHLAVVGGWGDPAPAARGAGWGMAGAAAATLLALSFVLGGALAIGAVALGVFALVGWAARASSEHTGRPVNLLPVGLPVVGLFTVGALMFFMSRILLAVPEQASTLIALVVAVLILAGASLVAFRPSLGSGALVGGLAVAAGLLVVGGTVAASVGERPEEGTEEAAAMGPVNLTAKQIAFDRKEMTFKAGAPAVIHFVNDDKNIPHNVAVYTGPDAAREIFAGDGIAGPRTTEYTFKAPPPGTYLFRCDFHPNMSGTLTTTPEAGGAGHGEKGHGQDAPGKEKARGDNGANVAGNATPGGADHSGTTTLTAKNIAFDKKDLSFQAGAPATIHFKNDDSGTPHNVAVYTGPDATTVVFRGEIVTGSTTTDYKFDAPGPGTYFFRCDVHTNMTGTVTVR